ncbi:hypothetical protein KC867_01335 [Candidatus Saccharibacteria bacterium]|nr:hypothetical protein [Candidatus Saccharibacteria bacterium]
MKIKKALLAVAVFSATLASSLLLDNGQAFAAVKTWTGGGGDTNFSTSGNWSPSGAPVDGDSIDLPLATIFGECADRSLVYDLNSSINLSGLSITGEKPADCYCQAPNILNTHQN